MDNWKPKPKDLKRVWKPNFIDPAEIEARNTKNEEAFRESLKSKDGMKMAIAFAKAEIEKLLGIQLTTIELVGMNKIAREIAKKIKKDEEDKVGGASMVELHKEIQGIFLLRFYNIHSEDELRAIFPAEKDTAGKYVWPTQIMHEYFQREQAKLHNEL